MAEAGRALAGRYRRKRRIAAGGIADGWQACDLATGRPAAVWLLRAGCVGGAERFLAAARCAAQLRTSRPIDRAAAIMQISSQSTQFPKSSARR